MAGDGKRLERALATERQRGSELLRRSPRAVPLGQAGCLCWGQDLIRTGGRDIDGDTEIP